jgi:putative membrane protein
MTLSWLVAAFHLLALAIGLGAIGARALSLSAELDAGGIRRVLLADSLWGIAALLWIVTGLWRAFGGLDKGTAFYLGAPVFHAKLTLFLLVVLLEIRPMVTLIGWRSRLRRGLEIDRAPARLLARVSFVQAALVVAIVFAATALARGIGA